jgi:hypothetical protein
MKIFLIEDKSGLSYCELKYSEVRFGLFQILEFWNFLDYQTFRWQNSNLEK